MSSSLALDVVILCGDPPPAASANPQKLAEFLGASSKVISVSHVLGGRCAPDWPSARCLIVEADALVKIRAAVDSRSCRLSELLTSTPHVFVHGFQPSRPHVDLLAELSRSYVGVQALPSFGGAFTVTEREPLVAGQLAGLSLGSTAEEVDRCFAVAAIAEKDHVVLSAAGRPTVVRVNTYGSDLWLSACSAIADIDAAVVEEDGLLPWFSRLAPLMLFLRGSLGAGVFRNPRSRACFIIDDPFLKDQYGFLEFSTLLDVMRTDRFSTSIAFIPWNYRRSQKRIAELFASQSPLASLCVHGCDHTSAEYGTLDAGSLYGRSRVALDRMHAHQRKFGVQCDEVMVFPQGVFSSEALRALDACGYLAAVNSHLCPTDMPGTLVLRDLMEVASTRCPGVPLFGRRYPTDPAEFAFDLFLGKPALIVEHHGYFRDGCRSMREFAARLSALDRQLEWTNLATICAESCLTRADADGSTHIRFFTNRFSLTNSSGQPARYVLLRKLDARAPLSSITVNGGPYPGALRSHDLVIELLLNPHQSADVVVALDPRQPADLKWRQTAWYKSRVFLRRLSCDLRDDYVDTSRTLSHVVSGLRGVLARSKASAN